MKKMMNSILVGVVLLAAGSVCSAEEPSGWQVEITPYLWLAGLEGDRGNELDIRMAGPVFGIGVTF